MGILSSLFKRSKDLSLDSGDLIAESRNWYSDRYETAVVQRNILLVVLVLSLVAIFIGVFVIGQVTLSKSIEPFVVEIEEKSGVTNVVNPAESKTLIGDEVLKRYFIVRYLRARETYDAVDYEYNYFTIVRLLSRPDVYRSFNSFVKNDPLSPVKRYGQLSKTTLKVKSVQFVGADKAQVRFTLIESGSNATPRDKIAMVRIAYEQMELNAEERYINPLGFQIIEYKVDDEAI